VNFGVLSLGSKTGGYAESSKVMELRTEIGLILKIRNNSKYPCDITGVPLESIFP
jgi:hypothetical protein